MWLMNRLSIFRKSSGSVFRYRKRRDSVAEIIERKPAAARLQLTHKMDRVGQSGDRGRLSDLEAQRRGAGARATARPPVEQPVVNNRHAVVGEHNILDLIKNDLQVFVALCVRSARQRPRLIAISRIDLTMPRRSSSTAS
jgi:hypothetical protein